MEFDIKEHTILMTVAGSRAYGMAQSSSDVDIKGLCIPPRIYRDGFRHKFEQVDKPFHLKKFVEDMTEEEQKIIKDTKLEGSIYEIRKFFQLAAVNNPNLLDILFCRDNEVRVTSPAGKLLREHRNDFLSTKCRFTFAGYARDQLKRINSHRKWILNPATHKPTREEFGLSPEPEFNKDQLQAVMASIKKKLDSWEIDYGDLDQAGKIYIKNQIALHLGEQRIASDEKFAAACRTLGYTENFIYLLQKEKEYKAAVTNWKQYQNWKKNRNPERAALEAKYGMDLKHCSHLVRLYRMCLEILEKSEVNVWREDAEELLAIRNGAWTYSDLMDFVEKQEPLLDKAYKESALPKQPNLKKLENLCVTMIEEFK